MLAFIVECAGCKAISAALSLENSPKSNMTKENIKFVGEAVLDRCSTAYNYRIVNEETIQFSNCICAQLEIESPQLGLFDHDQ